MATERRVGTRRGAAAEGRGWALAATAAAVAAVDAEMRGRDPARHLVAIAVLLPETIRLLPLPTFCGLYGPLFVGSGLSVIFSPVPTFAFFSFLFSCNLEIL